MLLLQHKRRNPEGAHAETRRKTFQLHALQLSLQKSKLPQEPHADSFGRKTLQLRTMHFILHSIFYSQDTHTESLRKKAFQLLAM